MSPYQKIYQRAVKRKGNEKALRSLMPPVLSKTKIVQITDDRFLAAMTKCIFQAGFSWKVIENKWPDFEKAFYKFSLKKLAALKPDDWDAYGRDVRIVRNMQKIMAVVGNVHFINQIRNEHKSFGRFISNWPSNELVELFFFLKKEGSRLGGTTSQIFLRRLGCDTFILSSDVVACLQELGLKISNQPTSKRDYREIQKLFNDFKEESGKPFSHLSRILSYSVGINYPASELKKQLKTPAY